MGMGGVFTIGDISENYFVLFRMVGGWLAYCIVRIILQMKSSQLPRIPFEAYPRIPGLIINGLSLHIICYLVLRIYMYKRLYIDN